MSCGAASLFALRQTRTFSSRRTPKPLPPADGTPILTMSLKQQVILDVVENTFTTVNINTVTSASTFAANGKTVRLGNVGHQFRTFISGRANDTGTPAGFVIAGYVVPIASAAP
jgi:hypothetical protein